MDALHGLTPEELGKLFPIFLREYDPAWKDLFEKEKGRITRLFRESELVRISHIGSTAVPGLISKPSIDILLEVGDGLPDERIIRVMKSAGYLFIERPDKPIPHMMFVKGYTPEGFKGQAFHVHVRYGGDWEEIRFRDYLVENPSVAEAYAELKKQLAQRFPNDRDAYTLAKTDFVEKVNTLARNNAYL
jgi:GrpB-like predicted nucleotidyltransferase (UPF0157 family)